MSWKEWVDKMLGRPTTEPAHAAIIAKEDELIARNAKRKGISPREFREQANRRAALQIEAESYRRGHG